MAVQTELSQVLDLLRDLADSSDDLNDVHARLPRRQVDQQIQRLLRADTILHESILPSLYRRLNDTSPISQLPDEVLVHIFMLCRDDEYLKRQNDPITIIMDTKHRPAWTTVTYTCTRWRTISLKSPLLWSRIVNFLTDAWIALFLRRSVETPLDVTINYSGHSSQTLDMIVSQSQRWQNVEITATPEQVASIFHINVQRPFLKSLSLLRRKWGMTILDTRTDPIILRDSALDSHGAPRLRHLKLDMPFQISSSSSILPALVSLTCSLNLSKDRMLNLLASTSQLNTLRLMGGRLVEASDDVQVPLSHEPIRMSSLRILELSNRYPWSCRDFLRALCVPSLRQAHFKFEHWERSCEPLFNTLSPCAENIRCNGAPVHTMILSYGKHDFVLMGWSEASAEVMGPAKGLVPTIYGAAAPGENEASISMKCRIERSSTYNFSRCLPLSCNLLGLQSKSTKILKLYVGDCLTLEIWRKFLRFFDGVEVLDIYEHPVPTRVDFRSYTALKAILSDDPTSPSTLPRLKKIIYSYYTKIPVHGGHILDPLRRLAECRKTAGTPLEIDFDVNSSSYSHHITSVLERSAKVTWGGKVIPSFSLDEAEDDTLEEMWQQLFGP